MATTISKILLILVLISFNAIHCMIIYPPQVAQKIIDDRCLLACALACLDANHGTMLFELDTPEKRTHSLSRFTELWRSETKSLGNSHLKCSIKRKPIKLFYKFESHLKNAQINEAWFEELHLLGKRNTISLKELTDIVAERFPELLIKN